MNIYIDNRQNTYPIDEQEVLTAAQIILTALKRPEDELSIVIVDDFQITDLNQQFLNRTGPTNVIAFPMQEGEFAGINPHLLGDVVISVDTAAREAQNAGITFQNRFEALLIHGILHLIGYDHVNSTSEAEQMENQSNVLIQILKTKRKSCNL